MFQEIKSQVNFILMAIAITTYKDIGKLKGSKAYLMKAHCFIKGANGIFNTNSNLHKTFCFMTLRMAQWPWWLQHFLKYVQPLTELHQQSQQSLTV